MKIGHDGLAIVKAFESCMRAIKGRPGYFAAYYDPVNVLTIGWGHTNHHQPRFDAATVWSQAQCDSALAGDMATFEAHVNRMAKVPLKQHEFDALVSWAFNTGGPSTASVWRLLNVGDKASIPANLAQWNKGTVNGEKKVLNGLTRRRKAEGLLFQGKIKEAHQVAGSKPVMTTKKAAAGAVVVGTVATGINQGWGMTAWLIAGAVLAAAVIAAVVISKR
jgi:lysozyme